MSPPGPAEAGRELATVELYCGGTGETVKVPPSMTLLFRNDEHVPPVVRVAPLSLMLLLPMRRLVPALQTNPVPL